MACHSGGELVLMGIGGPVVCTCGGYDGGPLLMMGSVVIQWR